MLLLCENLWTLIAFPKICSLSGMASSPVFELGLRGQEKYKRYIYFLVMQLYKMSELAHFPSFLYLFLFSPNFSQPSSSVATSTADQPSTSKQKRPLKGEDTPPPPDKSGKEGKTTAKKGYVLITFRSLWYIFLWRIFLSLLFNPLPFSFQPAYRFCAHFKCR